MVRKYLLLLLARPLSELFTYFNFSWRAPSEFFLISMSVFKSFPLLSLDWTSWYVRSTPNTGKMAKLGVAVTLATLNCIYALAEWQDILKGLEQKHDLNFCACETPGNKLPPPTALPILPLGLSIPGPRDPPPFPQPPRGKRHAFLSISKLADWQYLWECHK